MTGCGEKKNEQANSIQTSQPASNKDADQKERENKSEVKKNYEKFDYLTNTYSNPSNNGTIDGPNLISFQEGGIANIWNADGQYFISVVFYEKYMKDSVKTVEDIIPNLKDLIILSSRKARGEIRDVVISSQKKVTINGIETNRFEGYFDSDSSDGSVSDKYIVGYSLFFKDEPMYLMGVVSSNGQEQEYKDTVTKTVDDMIKTLRDGAVAE
jgi:hypothetical protein